MHVTPNSEPSSGQSPALWRHRALWLSPLLGWAVSLAACSPPPAHTPDAAQPSPPLSDAAPGDTAVDIGSDASPSPARDSLLLNVAPMDGHLFASWSFDANGERRGYRLHYRPRGVHSWTTVWVHGRDHAITGLANGEVYELLVTVEGPQTASSGIVVATPRVREDCDDPFAPVFCSWSAAAAWVAERGIDLDTLRCRNEPVGAWDNAAPNCYYTDGEEQLFLLDRFLSDSFSPTPYRELSMVRRALRRAIWPGDDPFERPDKFKVAISEVTPTNVGQVENYASATTLRLEYDDQLDSRITWFEPASAAGSPRYLLYHHGHACAGGCTGTIIEAQAISWWLARGWQVIHVDMPLHGINGVGAPLIGGTNNHFFAVFDDGVTSPIQLFMLPIKHAVDLIVADATTRGHPEPRLVMMGRSGGGWSTVLYSALDERIEAAIPVAGCLPLSMRMRVRDPSVHYLHDIGDYEQMVPHIYDAVPYGDLMRAAGELGALFIFNRLDSCCFRLEPDDPLVDYLQSPLGSTKLRRVWIDMDNTEHSTSDDAFPVIESFLADLYGTDG